MVLFCKQRNTETRIEKKPSYRSNSTSWDPITTWYWKLDFHHHYSSLPGKPLYNFVGRIQRYWDGHYWTILSSFRCERFDSQRKPETSLGQASSQRHEQPFSGESQGSAVSANVLFEMLLSWRGSAPTSYRAEAWQKNWLWGQWERRSQKVKNDTGESEIQTCKVLDK